MENWFDFLLHASIGFSLFFLLYWLLLRQSTHFKANRVYLLASVLMALIVAAFPFHYTVSLQPITNFNLTTLTGVLNHQVATEGNQTAGQTGTTWSTVLLFAYLTGATLFSLRLLIQTWKPLRVIHSSKPKIQDGYYIHENDKYALPFSFFNHVLINPKYLKQDEINEILSHEHVHIRERHWIDLLIIELLTVIFWFNPFIWFIELAIKQNHEYLADQGVISRGHSPVRYQALLVNQLMGMQVIGITNNLNFALGPTRLNMMKRQKTSKKKLFRMAWGIPVLAFMLVAFAEPKYQAATPVTNKVQPESKQAVKPEATKTIHGTVVNEKGEPMTGATVLIRHTTKGTVVDENGNFSLEVPEQGCELVISFVGYKTIVRQVTPKKNNPKFRMEKTVIAIDPVNKPSKTEMPPPPPPPTAVSKQADNNAKKDGPVFFVVEDMPQYPGGDTALKEYIESQKEKMLKKAESEGKKLKGKSYVNFVIQTDGSVAKIKIARGSGSRYTDEKAIEIVKEMDNWTPGKQRGKPVSVSYTIPIEF
jgi:TonB family protein